MRAASAASTSPSDLVSAARQSLAGRPHLSCSSSIDCFETGMSDVPPYQRLRSCFSLSTPEPIEGGEQCAAQVDEADLGQGQRGIAGEGVGEAGENFGGGG